MDRHTRDHLRLKIIGLALKISKQNVQGSFLICRHISHSILKGCRTASRDDLLALYFEQQRWVNFMKKNLFFTRVLFKINKRIGTLPFANAGPVANVSS